VFAIRIMSETEVAELRARLEAFERRTGGPATCAARNAVTVSWLSRSRAATSIRNSWRFTAPSPGATRGSSVAAPTSPASRGDQRAAGVHHHVRKCRLTLPAPPSRLRGSRPPPWTRGRAGAGAEGPVRVCTDYCKASAADMATFRPARRTRIAISASFIDDMTMMVFAISHI
jgi:hypothetical protein